MFGARDLQNAVAEGDTRTISLHHVHTDEDITITYKRDGRYDEAALEKLNWFLRDWRRSEQTNMDPQLIDLVWEVQREVGSSQPIYVVCGYRAPETNEMLRHHSSGVARFSQHMLGKAMDFYIPGAPLSELRVIGLRLARGGVGFYPTSGSPFVHMDTGNVRMWPRMSREELARVFPDGRTVQIPSDGRPMSGFAFALADIRKHGGDASANSAAAAHDAGMNITAAANNMHMVNPFAKLLGLAKDDDGEDADAVAEAETASPAPSGVNGGNGRTHLKPTLVASADEKAPGSNAYHLASVPRDARTEPAKTAMPLPQGPASRFAELTPNQIITARGYWDGLANGAGGGQSDAQAALQNALRMRSVEMASADPDITGALNSWPADADGHQPAQFALAYAADQAELSAPSPSTAHVATASAPVPNPSGKLIAEGGTSVAAKGVIDQPKTSYQTAIELAADEVTNWDNRDNPWLRALILSPSVELYLTALALSAPDYTTLAALMVKPARAVMMTFSADPYLGLAADRFDGSAIAFVSTVTYATAPTYTAALQ
jgi:uncharacterized protein YcbK (DUF882 family)